MKALKLGLTAFVIMFVIGGPAFGYTFKKKNANGEVEEYAGPDHPVFSGAAVGAGLGAGVTIIGAGYGFGRIGAAALESMARQPETAGKVQTAMLIIAALLEGATFFSLIVCIQVAGTGIW
jgi:F-type H+-transporting ATPase subunit c